MKKQEEKIKEGDSIFVVWVTLQNGSNHYEIVPAVAKNVYLKGFSNWELHSVEMETVPKSKRNVYDYVCFLKEENAKKFIVDTIEGRLKYYYKQRKSFLEMDQTVDENHKNVVDIQLQINSYLSMKQKFL